MIFFKGCPLRCPWCSNPESQTYGLSLMYDENKCKNFGTCIELGDEAIQMDGNQVVIDRSAIQDVSAYQDVCVSKALTTVGEKLNIDDIIEEIEKDLPFYKQSGGGVTLSGGEPLAQNELLFDLIQEIKKRDIHLSVETTLYVPWEKIYRCLGKVDTFLVDLKHTNPAKFNVHTEGDLDLVLENLKRLNETKEHIIVRIPVVPGFNHTTDEMTAIINMAASLDSVREVHFIPYHTLGAHKYRMLGMEYPYKIFDGITPQEIEPYSNYARSAGLKTKIGG